MTDNTSMPGGNDPTKTLEDHVETLDTINTELQGRLDRQGASSSQVDTKSALLAALAATGTQFLASRKDPAPAPIWATSAYVCYAITFITAVASYAVLRFTDVPQPQGLGKVVNQAADLRGCCAETMQLGAPCACVAR